MAASSPAKSNSSASEVTSFTAAAALSYSNPSKTLRGLNKPKCIKCGNVARSRCPYQSCKSCCAKAQNPCHIHVLKGNSSLPDKPPSSNSPLFDQQSSEAPHSGNTQRLRQLSTNFAQFNNLQSPIRSRKTLTRKDAKVINEWRFLKLKEFKEGNVAAETEAFNRYMQNVGLLEEIFMVNSETDGRIQNESSSEMKPENVKGLVDNLKMKLQSDPARTENFRKRIQFVVDHGLKKLAKFESVDDTTGNDDDAGLSRMSKKIKSSQSERDLTLKDLVDKLNKARNEDDLKACLETASSIFEWKTKMCQMPGDGLTLMGKNTPLGSSTEQRSFYDPPMWVSPTTIEQEALSQIDELFSSLEEIVSL